MNIQTVLTSLSRIRPIFHNEADFQHAFAWELREHYDCRIRLERRMELDSKRRTYLDIWIEWNSRKIAVELKYKMSGIEHTFEDETFSLLNQGAHDIARYDVIKDLHRLEQMVKKGLVDEGYLVFLTNDSLYYLNPGVEKTTADRDFRVHEGRHISGLLKWSESTGMGTMKGREEPIAIEGSYILNWQPYCKLNERSSGIINALVIPVNDTKMQSLKRVPQLSNLDQVLIQETPVMTEVTGAGTLTEIASIVKSIDSVLFSQMDLRDKLAARLQAAGYQINVSRNLGIAKVDIWAEKGQERIAVEVRYKTALLDTVVNGSHIHLKNQAAQDIARYDFLKDIEKLESIVSQRPGTRGYAVMITNDRSYWKKSERASSVDEDFRIHQGRSIYGPLRWNNASGGTVENREKMIVLGGEHLLNWQPYLKLGAGKNEVFQMLIVEV